MSDTDTITIGTKPITAAEIAEHVARDVAGLRKRPIANELLQIVVNRVTPALAQRDEWLINTNAAANEEAGRYLAEIREIESQLQERTALLTSVRRFVQSGAANWFGYDVTLDDGQEFTVSVAVKDGKSAVERIAELTAVAAAADALLGRLDGYLDAGWQFARDQRDALRVSLQAAQTSSPSAAEIIRRAMQPIIPLILHCPRCHLQHVDVDDDSGKWATERHHRKHLCKPEDGGCGLIWAPANVATVGVRELPEVRE